MYLHRRAFSIKYFFKWKTSFFVQWYSEPCKSFKIETFAKIVNGLKLLIVFAKILILDDWQDSEYVSVLQAQILLFYKKHNV